MSDKQPNAPELHGSGPWLMTISPYTPSAYTTRRRTTGEMIETAHRFCADHGRSGGHVCFIACNEQTSETFDCRSLHSVMGAADDLLAAADRFDAAQAAANAVPEGVTADA